MNVFFFDVRVGICDHIVVSAEIIAIRKRLLKQVWGAFIIRSFKTFSFYIGDPATNFQLLYYSDPSMVTIYHANYLLKKYLTYNYTESSH